MTKANPSTRKLVFCVHQSYQHRRRLPDLMSHLAVTFGSTLELGIISRMPCYSPSSVERFLDKFDCPIKIADPEVYRREICYASDKPFANKHNYSYLSSPLPQRRQTKAWVKTILDFQRSAGATVFLSPSVLLKAINPLSEIQQNIEWIRTSLEMADGPLLANLTLTHTWLVDESLRNLLLNELTDLPADAFYIRVLWPGLTPRYGQLAQPDILQGYRQIMEALSAEDKEVILPTVALTGWLCSALGVGGFSLGPSRDQQAFVVEPVIRRQKGNKSPARRSRYFEPELMHIVDLETHDLLAEEGRVSDCTCPYCRELEAGNPGRSTWDAEAASLHYITNAAHMTSYLTRGNPLALAQARVRKAQKLLDSLDRTLRPQGENVPRHLGVWARVLQR